MSLALTGELPVIVGGTDFSSMSFDVDILKPVGGEAIYVDGAPPCFSREHVANDGE